ncbi:MAG TPA: hypothetical protein VKA03_01450 [Methylovirgula sp.]|nr:hypothetical protein [Methylovirgula sp.]
MNYLDIKGWVDAAKDTISLLTAAKNALPKGEHRDDVEEKLHQAEESIKRADARLAKELGLKLCDCEFPPNVMLWRETEQTHVCPHCGRRRNKPIVSRGVNYHQR